MAEIINLPNSFVQFSKTFPVFDLIGNAWLAIQNGDKFVFQFKSTYVAEDYQFNILDVTANLVVQSSTISFEELGDGYVECGGTFNINTPKSGACYVIEIYTPSDDNYFYSNPFKYRSDAVRIEYRNDKPFAGFVYPEDKYIRLRIACELMKPQLATDQETYKKSDGKTVLLSARLDREVEFHTDYYHYLFHQYLNVALMHDFFKILTGDFAGEYVLKDYGDVEYFDYDRRNIGKAIVKLTSTPLDVLNPYFD